MEAEAFAELNLHGIILPQIAPPHTDLLNLTPLHRSALQQPEFEALYRQRFTHFNPIQTQAFHTLYHTDENVLLGAPTGTLCTTSYCVVWFFQSEVAAGHVCSCCIPAPYIALNCRVWKDSFIRAHHAASVPALSQGEDTVHSSVEGAGS